jgi:hypothetical protein
MASQRLQVTFEGDFADTCAQNFHDDQWCDNWPREACAVMERRPPSTRAKFFHFLFMLLKIWKCCRFPSNVTMFAYFWASHEALAQYHSMSHLACLGLSGVWGQNVVANITSTFDPLLLSSLFQSQKYFDSVSQWFYWLHMPSQV